MIRNFSELAAIVAIGGALAVGCTAEEPTCPEGDTDCPTDGCPTDGCPTDGCPTAGCPTATSGFDAGYAASTDFFTLMTTGSETSDNVHGEFRIYYTETLRASITAGGAFTAPVGATAIKERLDDQDVVTAFTVMTKQAAGYDPDNGDWHYENRSADGTVTAEGAMAGCISCHMDDSTTDYLAGTTFTN